MPAIILLFLVVAATPAAAQWTASLRGARTTTSGYVESNVGTRFLPHAPSEYTVAVGRSFGPWEVRLGGRTISADLAAASDDYILVSRDAIHARGATLEVLRRIAGDGQGTTLQVAAGAELIRWKLPDSENPEVTKRAASGALEGSASIGSRWRVLLRGEVTVGSSIFDGDDFGEDLVRRAGIRRGIAVGIARHW